MKYSEEEYGQLDMVTPSVVGMTIGEAQAKLQEDGLFFDVVGDGDDWDNKVIEQIPESGSQVPKEGFVILYTQGYDIDNALVEVPDFFGLDKVNASYLAAVSKLQVSINGVQDEGALAMLQNIEPGSKVKKGTVITLTFANNETTEAFANIAE